MTWRQWVILTRKAKKKKKKKWRKRLSQQCRLLLKYHCDKRSKSSPLALLMKEILSPLLVMGLSPLPCCCSPWWHSPSKVPSKSGKVGIFGMAWQRDRRTQSSPLSILNKQMSHVKMPKLSCPEDAHKQSALTLACIGMLRILIDK